ncbi:MAG: NADH-quinone oxidoreductase subunit K [Candidatus Omnitrophota bacterium]
MIHFLIVLFAVSLLYIAITNRLEAYVKALFMQGLIIFLAVALEAPVLNSINFIFLMIETLGFKTIIIPLMLFKAIREMNVRREVEPYTMNFHSLGILTVMMAFAFVLAFLSRKYSPEIRPLHFGVSISTILTGLYVIMSRKKIITHILGFIVLENGIFLLSFSISREMPLMVNLGVLLDIFIGVFLLVVVLKRIHSTFDEIHIDTLTRLTD